jgi:hypothetical protein
MNKLMAALRMTLLPVFQQPEAGKLIDGSRASIRCQRLIAREGVSAVEASRFDGEAGRFGTELPEAEVLPCAGSGHSGMIPPVQFSRK